MSVNNLLLWMSARRSGSWGQFRSMVEDMDLCTGDWPYQRIRMALTSLSHAVFSANGGALQWTTPAPSMARACGINEPTAVLRGARTVPLLSRIASANAGRAQIQTVALVDGPDAIRIVTETEQELEEIARVAGITYEPDAARVRLAKLQPLKIPYCSKKTQLPFGRDVVWEKFIVERRRCHWETISAVEPAHEVELFRATRFQNREHYLFAGGFQRMDGQQARYLVLQSRRKQVIRYDPATRELRVPGICRPPLLVDQALILCTGLPPSPTGDQGRGATLTLTYRDIPADIAGLAGELLGQPRL